MKYSVYQLDSNKFDWIKYTLVIEVGGIENV
jgi:hypothetical protein